MAIVRPRKTVGFVMQLELKQQQLGLSHTAFAERLGFDRSWWYRLRHGYADPSLDLAQRVMRLWPGEFDRFLPELVLSRGLRPQTASNGA